MDILERYKGCLCGLATGDALGTTLEFKPPGSFEPVTDMVGGGPFQLEAGQWTDDTSMALCLAESLVECHGFDALDQLERYNQWYRFGHLSSTGACFDIGNTTRAALEYYARTGRQFDGPADAFSAGNGSLMRLAAVPLFYAGHTSEAVEKSGDSSRTTHIHPDAVDACRYFGGLLVGLMHGGSKEKILSECFLPGDKIWRKGDLSPEIFAVACGSFKDLEPPAIRGTGYVVKSLEAALWAFHKSKTFEEGCLLAVNLGDDADTTGAIYGQIAGAYYGMGGIPGKWLEQIAHRELIEQFAEKIYFSSQGLSYPSS